MSIPVRIVTLPSRAAGLCARANITLEAGDDVTVNGILDPTLDISGWALLVTIKDHAGNVAASLSTAAGQVSVNGPQGTYSFTLTALLTGTTLAPGDYNYAVARTDAGASGYLVKGRLSIKGF